MWRGEGFVYVERKGFVFVERRRLCICGEEKALHKW